jgi:hypothetical protein
MKRIWIMGPASFLVAVGVFLLETREKGPRVKEWTEVREPVNLEPYVKAKILAEMRTMMVAIDGIVEGVARDDLRLVEQAARSAGMRGALDDDPISRALPESFRKLGMRTHLSFEALADQMLEGKSAEVALKGLAEITGSCIGCHATYRIGETGVPHSPSE